MASGAAAPVRVIHGQNTKLTKTGHGIGYSLARDEIFTSSASAGAITVYRGDASGNVPPIRIIQGPKTRLVAPWALTVDDPHREITTIDNTTHTVSTFPIDAQGNVAPSRVLSGPHTLLGVASSRYSGAFGLGEDPQSNLIVVSTHTHGVDPNWPYGGLLIFDRTATGDTPPRAVIAGPHTGIKLAGNLVIANGRIFVNVSNRNWIPSYNAGGFAPRKGCTGPPPDILVVGGSSGFIGVWDEKQKGDVPPLYTIHGVTAEYIDLGGIAVDPKDGEVFITDGGHDGVLAYLVPDFFRSEPVSVISER
jgi:WD40 repeat protein